MWVSPYDIAGFDLGVDDGKNFYRVNVKRVTYACRSYRMYRSGCKDKHNVDVDPDFYLVWLADHNQFIELPGSVMQGKSSCTIPIDTIRKAIEK